MTVTDLAAKGQRMTSTPEEAEYELRSAVSSYWSGGRLLIGMYTFFVASLAFAYFYLRSSNSGDLWRPAHITAPTAIGAAVFAFTAASSIVVVYGYRRFQAGLVTDWQVAAWTAVGSLLGAIGLQIYQDTRLPFFPGSSGYASTFVGWTVMNLMMLVGALYWIETLVATSIRLRHALPAGETLAGSQHPRAQKFRANLESCTAFFQFAAAAGVLFWALFYLI